MIASNGLSILRLQTAARRATRAVQRKRTWRHVSAYWASLVQGNLGSIMGGLIIGWPAPTLKKLRQPDSNIHLTLHQEAWLASAVFYSCAISSIPIGQLINYLGRRNTFIVQGVLPVISWTLIYFSSSASMFIVARILSGIYVAGVNIIVPIYLSEISEPHVRGMFSSLSTVCYFMGIGIMYTVAPYVSIRTLAIMCNVLLIIFLISFIFCPESPYFYAMRQRPEAAAKSLTWLRGGDSISVELDVIRTSVEEEMKNDNGWFRNVVALVTVPANRKAFLSSEIMFVLNGLSGIASIRAFASVVLPSHLGPLTSDHCTMVFGIIQCVSALMCMTLIDKIGRKPLLYCSSLGIAITMFWTGVWYFFNEETDKDVYTFSWLPFAGFIVFGCSHAFGLGPVPKLYQSETMPSNLRGLATSFSTVLLTFFLALTVDLFPLLTQKFGIFSNFLFFSATGVVSFFFTYFCIMETKGKSLQMIRTELETGQLQKATMAKEVTSEHEGSNTTEEVIKPYVSVK